MIKQLFKKAKLFHIVLKNVLYGDGMLCVITFHDSVLSKNTVTIDFDVKLDEQRLKARVLGLAKRHFSPTKVEKITLKDNQITILLEKKED